MLPLRVSTLGLGVLAPPGEGGSTPDQPVSKPSAGGGGTLPTGQGQSTPSGQPSDNTLTPTPNPNPLVIVSPQPPRPPVVVPPSVVPPPTGQPPVTEQPPPTGEPPVVTPQPGTPTTVYATAPGGGGTPSVSITTPAATTQASLFGLPVEAVPLAVGVGLVFLLLAHRENARTRPRGGR